MSFSLGEGRVGFGKGGVQAILVADQSPEKKKKKYLLHRISHTFLSGEPQKSRPELERKKKKIKQPIEKNL